MTLMSVEPPETRRAPVVRSVLRAEDRAPILAILRATGVFRESEIEVALELLDLGLIRGDESGYRFVVSEDGDGAVTGYACYGIASMSERVYDLFWIAVRPDQQGTGVAAALLARVEESVRALGGHTVVIETEGTAPYAPARRFYAKSGYAEWGRVPDYYRAGADRVILGRRVSSAGERE